MWRSAKMWRHDYVACNTTLSAVDAGEYPISHPAVCLPCQKKRKSLINGVYECTGNDFWQIDCRKGDERIY